MRFKARPPAKRIRKAGTQPRRVRRAPKSSVPEGGGAFPPGETVAAAALPEPPIEIVAAKGMLAGARHCSSLQGWKESVPRISRVPDAPAATVPRAETENFPV